MIRDEILLALDTETKKTAPEIADEIDADRANVNRLLRDLEDDGLAVCEGRRLNHKERGAKPFEWTAAKRPTGKRFTEDTAP